MTSSALPDHRRYSVALLALAAEATESIVSLS